MNALFGDATTAMPTPVTIAERENLMGIGSPASMDLRRGTPQPGMFSANDAIPGLDIDPPDLEFASNGKPLYEDSRGRQQGAPREGVGGWINRMVSRTRQQSNTSERGGKYDRVEQDER